MQPHGDYNFECKASCGSDDKLSNSQTFFADMVQKIIGKPVVMWFNRGSGSGSSALETQDRTLPCG
jgi:hypothetical protein